MIFKHQQVKNIHKLNLTIYFRLWSKPIYNKREFSNICLQINLNDLNNLFYDF